MHRTVVLNVVGLAPHLLGDHTPHLSSLISSGSMRPLTTVMPAVTCSVQSTLVTGSMPSEHGCVANGWYFRDQSEVWLWRQSNKLVSGEKIWDAARRRDPTFTSAKLFWWYNMYSTADFTITPRPMYPADGRKLPDIYTQPISLRDSLQKQLGQFPLFNFWGPTADIVSSQWITNSAKYVDAEFKPTLNLIYLPHLDYNLQRLGPSSAEAKEDVRQIDEICGDLIDYFSNMGVRIVVLSEYGMTDVTDAVHINRVLRKAGLIAVREEMGHELLDPGASEAFALADHQLAHVYVRQARRIDEVKALLETVSGIETVLDAEGKRTAGLDHERSGELVAISEADRWFSYYYWLDDDRAPDFARTVEIHRKPGYDPVELFLDPELRAPKAKIGWKLLQKTLGFRTLMDLIPLDATLVKGSHGRLTDDPAAGPLLISSMPDVLPDQPHATDVKDIVLDHVFEFSGTRNKPLQ